MRIEDAPLFYIQIRIRSWSEPIESGGIEFAGGNKIVTEEETRVSYEEFR